MSNIQLVTVGDKLTRLMYPESCLEEVPCSVCQRGIAMTKPAQGAYVNQALQGGYSGVQFQCAECGATATASKP